MKVLHLHLKYKWFDQLPPKGEKRFEYRLKNDHWDKMLAKDYDEVWFYRGYQRAIEGETMYRRKFVKPDTTEIVSEEWNNLPQTCYAIPTDVMATKLETENKQLRGELGRD